MVIQAAAERRDLADDSTAADTLADIERHGRQTLTELRRLLGVLRVDDDAPLTPQPGIGDLDQLELLSSQYANRERFITELTLDPPNSSSEMANAAHQDDDFLVLSTIHSAKGMEWDNVYIMNVVEGSFPNEFAAGKAEAIEEERRLLYVAMTRARNELTCVVPLRFQITSQPKTSDGHVYGGRSRFLTEKVMKCFDEQTFQSANVEAKFEAATESTIDVASRLKQMW
jgi:DNA helicase-2/ATP-dependent DNA helicase PcrA